MPTSELPTYRIGAVARRTGLSEHLIRIWERRYGAVQPHRAESGLRLYSDANIHRLRLLRCASERGHAIGSIAALDDHELERLVGDRSPATRDPEGTRSSAETHVEAFLQAIQDLDPTRAEQVVAQADAALGSRATALGVLVPMLREVGRRWEGGSFSVAQEHAAAAVVRSYLGSAVRSLALDEHSPVAVSTTPPGELHEFGALVAAVFTASHGWRVVYLGPNLPRGDLVGAVRTLGANLLLLSAVVQSRGLEAFLDELRTELPRRVQIVVGGAAANRLRQVPTGVTRLSQIEELGPLLGEHIHSGASAR